MTTRLEPLRWACAAGILASPACPASDPDLPGGPQPYDVVAYALVGEYDWDQRKLLATVGITFELEDPPATIVLDSAVDVTAVHDAAGAELTFFADPAGGTLEVDIRQLAGQDPLQLHITYEAAESEALRAFDVRVGDPATTRAVYSFSEPLDVPRWMPCHNRPDDRASISIEMRMHKDEALIANGTRTLDETDGEARRTRWATDYSLPPYLMAFAIGPFATTTAKHGEIDIGTWRRPDLDGDFDLVVSELDRMIGVFEDLLGPYPFEKYQLILLPAVGGGVEHASITFQSETSSNYPSLIGDLDLTAHELAHQWWGDLVTVATWDDVWIKEGFATLMATEPQRLGEDQSGAGTLMGDFFSATADEAIRDPNLSPPDKYTSGPYDRTAWLLAQIRGVVGDDNFFTTVRTLLADHAFATIGTDDMIKAFAPHLGDAGVARMRNAIDAHTLPSLSIEASPGGGAIVTLHDKDELLVAPIDFEWRREDGTVEFATLVPEQPLTLEKKDPGDHLLIDPRDVHIRLGFLLADDASSASYYADLIPLVQPTGPDKLGEFAALPGVHQRFALTYAGLPPIAADELPELLAGLHSDGAKAIALRAACVAITAFEDPALQDPWLPVLTAAFTDDPPIAGAPWLSGYGDCAPFLDVQTMFADDWAALSAGLETPTLQYPRLVYLSKFELPDPETARDIWEPVVRRGHSLRVRGLAAGELLNMISNLDPHDLPTTDPWRALVLDLLASNEAPEVLTSMLYAVGELALNTEASNAPFLDAFVDILHNPATWPSHGRALCIAATYLVLDEAGWNAFIARLEGAPLSDRALEILADPNQCS